MDTPFKKLALAVTFSPTGKALLKETKRLKELFNSELILIHIGKKTKDSEKKLIDTIESAGLSAIENEIIWEEGDPANVIIKRSESADVDLLIAGALQKESFVKYYIGSVARKIMRSSTCNVMILKSPSENPVNFKKFYVSIDFTDGGKRTVSTAYQFALLEAAAEFVVVRDYNIPALSTAILDSGSIEELDILKSKYQKEEEAYMKEFIDQMDLKRIEIQTICIYGKEGWEATKLARSNNADIFAINVPSKKLKFLDRLFLHEAEYSFENLPSNLLIIR